jgi:hypothetical protein
MDTILENSTIAAEPKASATSSNDQAEAASAKTGAFTRVPNDLLARLLDVKPTTDRSKPKPKDSPYAVHLLAIKMSKGDDLNKTHTLNKKHAESYGISDRGFRAGVRLMRATILTRRQPGRRRLATEELAPYNKERFTCLPNRFLEGPSDVLAFVAAVNLAPGHARPEDVAKRIGHTSPKTVRKLVAAAGDAIAVGIGARKAIYVARKGYVFPLISDLGKNDTAKNDTAKNDSAHLRRKEDRAEGRKAEKKASHLPHATRSEERGGLAEDFLQDKFRSNPPSPEWQSLANWRAAKFFTERRPHFTGEPMVVMTLEEWAQWLAYFGGAPGHLSTPAAYEQALAIAHELSATPCGDDEPPPPGQAMAALAFAICREHAKGKPIRSLAFIAEHLVRQMERGDCSWAYDWQSRRVVDQKFFGRLYELARDAVDALERASFPIHRRALLSTMQIEELIGLSNKYGPQAVGVFLRSASAATRRPLQGNTVFGWRFFEPEIEREASRYDGPDGVGMMRPAPRHRPRRRAEKQSQHPY